MVVTRFLRGGTLGKDGWNLYVGVGKGGGWRNISDVRGREKVGGAIERVISTNHQRE